MVLAYLAACLLLSSGFAAPLEDHAIHERRSLSPRGWQKGDAVPADMILPMRIGLLQNNIDTGPDLLMELSDPRSAKYGQHYTAHEVIDLFAPRQETVDAVRSWLQASGIETGRISQSANKAWIQCDLQAEEAERLLSTKFHFFEHSDSGDLNVACDE